MVDEAKRRTEAVLETVGMADRAERPVRTYSKGMRQRIKLGQALIHDPDLLVLDEPLNGVDPVGREELNELFLRLAKAGKAVLISSYILNEMDELANHILFAAAAICWPPVRSRPSAKCWTTTRSRCARLVRITSHRTRWRSSRSSR